MAAITEKRSDVLYVKMLGGFSMSYNGKTIAGSSKSSISQNNALLQILIHARDKGVTRDRLEELLFGDREVDNAHHSLRSVIYNAKKYLEKAGLPKVNYILSEKDVFYWTNEIEVEEDACEFEELHRRAGEETDPEKRLDSYLKACYEYGGEFLPMQSGNVWAVRESMRYGKLFADCVENAGDLLRERQDYERMRELGQYAAAIAPLSDWETLTMEALVRLRRYDEAVRFYEATVNYYLDELGVHPSGKILEWFEQLGKGMDHHHTVLEDIVDVLDGEDGSSGGGYLCSYPVFQGIYRSNRRLLDRTGTSSYLMLCTILDGKGNPMKNGNVLDRLSERLVDSACCSVRRGDTLCAYGKGQCLILLVNTTREDCSIVQQRINKNFIVGRQRISVQYDISSVCPDERSRFRKTS
ncbi:MAG: BTAD domain-containing putative transcriptional regulator [Eubacteriales bacterium]|nr:BTAD domain-containing putative transcriptional regulator [Eubacteriales bacterium]